MISVRGQNNVSSGSTVTSIAVNVPSGTTNGDLMLAIVYVGSGFSGFTPPAGWTLVGNLASGTFNWWVYKRTALSEPASYTWSWTTAEFANATIISLYGTAGETIAVDLAASNSFGASTSQTNGALTTASDSEFILVSYKQTVGSALTLPPEMPALFTTAGNGWAVGWFGGAAAGAQYGSFACSSGTSAAWNVLQVGISGQTGPYVKSRTQAFFSGGTTSIPVSVPGNAAPGDLLLAIIAQSSGNDALTPPGGWTQVRLDTVGGAGDGAAHALLALYSRVVQGGDPSSYTWTFAANTSFQKAAMVVLGGTGSTLCAVDTSAGANGTAVNPIAPSVTTAGNNELIAYAAVINTGTTLSQLAGDLLLAVNASGGFADAVGWRSSAGATGTKTFGATGSTSAVYLAHTVAILQAVPGPAVFSGLFPALAHRFIARKREAAQAQPTPLDVILKIGTASSSVPIILSGSTQVMAIT